MQRRLSPFGARLRALVVVLSSALLPLVVHAAPETPPGVAGDRELSLRITPQLATPTPALSTVIPPPAVSVQAQDDDAPRVATIDLTKPPEDLWQRIRNGFSMPNLESPLVADRQAWYLNRPAALKVMTQRSRRYLYHIVNELEKRGMPMELALLPMVESAFNPLAASPAKALGMWQFIPSTGRNYNLTQNWWIDQRRDVVASTNAALDYLQAIYDMHGDWHLALASYNWGENAVGKAVARNQAKGLPTDYLSLTMPGETRYYVPKLQALKNIINNPILFGIALEPIPNKPYFDTVDLNTPVDVATAAKLAEIPLDEFMALNPGHSRPLIKDGTGTLIVPADKVATFQANLAQYEQNDKPLALWHTESLKKGEKLDAFAARHGLSLSQLKQINGISARAKLAPGFNLLVPRSGTNADQVLARLPPAPPEPKAAAKGKKGKASKAAGKGKGGKAAHGHSATKRTGVVKAKPKGKKR